MCRGEEGMGKGEREGGREGGREEKNEVVEALWKRCCCRS